MGETRELTLMFYFASDNPLAPAIVSQLKALKEAGFHPEANVIVYFDPNAENTPAHIFDVDRVNKIRAGSKYKIGFPLKPPFGRNQPCRSERAGARHARRQIDEETARAVECTGRFLLIVRIPGEVLQDFVSRTDYWRFYQQYKEVQPKIL
jgi:hypothetical protein